MKSYTLSFALGCVVGWIYAACKVKSPAPPIVALIGLLGMVIGESSLRWFESHIH